MNKYYIWKPDHFSFNIVLLGANFVKFFIGFGDSIPYIQTNRDVIMK